MKGWMAALGVTCAWASPGLLLVALVLALLDLTVMTQRWATLQPSPPASAGTVAVTVAAEGCSPALAPELRDMIGRD
jgi:hypothetical protein